jgi:hypothetical protein
MYFTFLRSDSTLYQSECYASTVTYNVPNENYIVDRVDAASGVDVSVFAPGLRNPFDIVWTTSGKLYGSDNGMNSNFGDVSTSAKSQVPPKDVSDKINLLVQGVTTEARIAAVDEPTCATLERFALSGCTVGGWAINPKPNRIG